MRLSLNLLLFISAMVCTPVIGVRSKLNIIGTMEELNLLVNKSVGAHATGSKINSLAVINPVNDSLQCAQKMTDACGGNKSLIPFYDGKNVPEVSTALQRFLDSMPPAEQNQRCQAQLLRIKTLLVDNKRETETETDTENPE
jgi:hypothetical protein